MGAGFAVARLIAAFFLGAAFFGAAFTGLVFFFVTALATFFVGVFFFGAAFFTAFFTAGFADFFFAIGNSWYCSWLIFSGSIQRIVIVDEPSVQKQAVLWECHRADLMRPVAGEMVER